MRAASLLAVSCLPLACGSGSQTGPVGPCQGASLSGAAAFAPRAGLVYQQSLASASGTSTPGAYVVLIWGGGDGGPGFDAVCGEVVDAGFPLQFFVAPQTVALTFGDGLATGSSQTTVFDLAAPTGSGAVLEDILAGADVAKAGSACLTGSFNAGLVLSNPVDGTAADAGPDGGAPLSLTSSFDLPFCR